MPIVECGLKVWLVKATKNKPILPSKELEGRMVGKTVHVGAEVEISGKSLYYFLYWQQTDDYPLRRATCTINTLTPALCKNQRNKIAMVSGPGSVVYSTEQPKVFGKAFRVYSSVFSASSLEKHNGVVGYVQLQVNFLKQTAASTEPSSVI
ncbi:hypothetical protein D9757_008785 [Collybiopsis confluens]|uniref:Uncharacterized protein n=1 Tax=Collybiopsis confluens TaxID=2823264 RepID=A0A8H5H5L8_9AGAR|nr:hypothetical protein D9757_008785 [Collybiopsis confluens]